MERVSARAAPNAASTTLQRKSAGQAAPTHVPPIVHEVLNSPGQPLDAATRAYMEPRFGHDFSKVRVHADGKAGEAARAVNALAYTVGAHVAFGAHQYVPRTDSGRRLLAHELVHVMQQGQRPNLFSASTVAPPNGAAESEANHLAAFVTDRHWMRTVAFGSPQTESMRRLASQVRPIMQQRPSVQRKESVEAHESTSALERQTQEDGCRLEMAIGKIIYCFEVISIADKPGRWKVTATTPNKNPGGKTPIEYTGDVEIKIVNGKHRTKPVGVFKLCSSDPTLLKDSCIWVDEVNFTRMLDLELEQRKSFEKAPK
jgi:hypothetical protein